MSAETTQIHTRILKCALEIDESREFWTHALEYHDPHHAFENYWFGARSYPYTQVLLTNFRARFSAHPNALRTLHRWRSMTPDTRRTLCHWHMMISDPMYRSFTGEFLVQRHNEGHTHIDRDRIITWVADQGPGRWTIATRIQFAGKLMNTAHSAGLLSTNRDPRPLHTPPTPDDALTYGLYLLRETEFSGTLLDNPYFRSLALTEDRLEDRLRKLSAIKYQRQGQIIDFGWQFPDLWTWAQNTLPEPP